MQWPQRIALLILILSAASCQTVEIPEISTPTQLIQLRFEGQVREYWVHVPPGLEPGPHPVMILLHGTDSDGFNIMRTGGFFAHAAKEQYVILAPNAAQGAFNIQRDSAFITTILSSLSSYLGYEHDTYLVGYDQGAEFAMNMVTRSDAKFDGLALVGGLTSTALPKNIDATSTMIIVGEEDPVLFSAKREHPDSISRAWSKAMQCSTTVRATIDFVRYTTRYGCAQGARFVYLVIGDHGSQWPRAKSSREIVLFDPRSGPYNRHFDAANVIWRFFSSGDSRPSLDL